MFHRLHDLFNVSRETYDKLEIYRIHLVRWQRALNIVSRETIDDFWSRHIIDSLQIAWLIKGRRVLDIGSGGGFPGMALAIGGNFAVTCVEADIRKSIFLEEAARLTGTTVEIKNIRIEDLNDCNFDTVVARGFSPLANLIDYVLKHSSRKYGVFLKGKTIYKELAAAEKKHSFEHAIFASKSDERGKIITITCR
jgi:16S rRNA (guanine527-N7)-methyltransferase